MDDILNDIDETISMNKELDDKFTKIAYNMAMLDKNTIMIIDLETTGIPAKGYQHNYTKNELYNNARIVQVAWIIYDAYGNKLYLKNYIRKPYDFTIPKESINIHNITNSEADEDGIDIDIIIDDLYKDLKIVKFVVAHNAEFDISIIKNEMYRLKKNKALKLLEKKEIICTKKTTVSICHLKNANGSYKSPKLSELYDFCFKSSFDDAHNAVGDIKATAYCFFYLRNNYNLYSQTCEIKDDKFRLNEQQLKIIKEDINKNMLVTACAGSGKTTTILHKLKYLIDLGVDPSTITLTTFTRDASNDMKRKLEKIIGINTELEVGTIDSIALRNINKYGKDIMEYAVSDVSEYSNLFLKFLCTHPNRYKYLNRKKYLFVDEYQDINDTQYSIIKAYYDNGIIVNAIGDDAQNIYSFRGSNIEYIFKFQEQFKNTVKHTLTINYRSTPEIIALANASIEHNKLQMPKKMISIRESNVKPCVIYSHTMKKMLENVRTTINMLVAEGSELHDIAVLSPINYPLISLENELSKAKINCVLLEGKQDMRVKIKQDSVCLSTIHKSKGLEWKYVLIIGMNDELFPMKKNTLEIEESRRLFYVATTRAKDKLYYFFSKFSACVYVTRYLSEISTNLYTPKLDCKHFGLSKSNHGNCDLSVSALLENLDGDDYTKLRFLNIIPNVEVTKIKLHDEYIYQQFVKDNDIYSDFGIYIDCLISHKIGMHDKISEGLTYRHAIRAIANVKVNNYLWAIYQKYKENFEDNIRLISQEDNEHIIERLENGYGDKIYIKQILPKDIKAVCSIVKLMQINSTKMKIPIELVPIFPDRFIPEEFEQDMVKNLIAFTSGEKCSSSVVWTISKCNKIVTERRRRLLYKDINIDDLDLYSELYNDIDKFIELLDTQTKCHYYLLLKNGVYGELDLFHGDEIYDYKVSNRPDMQGAWLLQLLCYTHLARNNNLHINRICVYNPLQGTIFKMNISKWNKGEELINYLLEKRNQVLNRTYLIKSKEEKEQQKNKEDTDDDVLPNDVFSD